MHEWGGGEGGRGRGRGEEIGLTHFLLSSCRKI